MRIQWNRHRLLLGGVGRSRWPRGRKWGLSWEPPGGRPVEQHLLVIWAGRGRFRLRQGWVPLTPGVCIWIRPGFPYLATQDPEQPIHLYFLNFTFLDDKDRPVPPETPMAPEHIVPSDPEFAIATSRRIVELCYGFDPTGLAVPPFPPSVTLRATAMLTSLLMELDASADRRDSPRRSQPSLSSRYESMVREATRAITEEAGEPLSVAALARRAGCSVSLFCSKFRLVTGQSPQQFAMRSRIHRAERLLRETDLPVAEVAQAAGYRDPCFLSRQFKQFHGIAPLHYRQRHRGR